VGSLFGGCPLFILRSPVENFRAGAPRSDRFDKIPQLHHCAWMGSIRKIGIDLAEGGGRGLGLISKCTLAG
jgi:hypothetical protein